MMVRRIAETFGISKSSAHRILSENHGLTRVCARWVPHLLTPQMKLHRVMACEENLGKCFHDDQKFLKQVVTGDEPWIHFYDPESKLQSSVWKSP